MGKVLVNDFQNVVSLTHNGHAVGVSGIGGYFTYQVLCVQNPVHSSAQEPYISTKKPWISTKKPWKSAKKPYISAIEPHTRIRIRALYIRKSALCIDVCIDLSGIGGYLTHQVLCVQASVFLRFSVERWGARYFSYFTVSGMGWLRLVGCLKI